MGDIGKVAIATDCRDLHFVNVATVGVFAEVHRFSAPLVIAKIMTANSVKGPDQECAMIAVRLVPTAFSYWYDAQVGQRCF